MAKLPQPDLSESDPRHCRVLSPHPQQGICVDSLLEEGGLPSDYTRHRKIQPVEIANGRDPRRPIEERYYSKLRSMLLSRTCPVLASVADGPGGHRSGLKSAPAKARPDCLSWPHSCDLAERVCPREVRSGMRDHVSRGKFYGLADEDTAINILEVGEMCLPPARPHRSHGLSGNISGEGTSTVHNLVSRDASPSGKFDSIAHEHARSILGGRWSADGAAKASESAFGCQTWGPQFPQAPGGHRPNDLKLKPIIGGDGSELRIEFDVQGTSTTHNPLFRGVSPRSHGLSGDISGEGTSTVHNHLKLKPIAGGDGSELRSWVVKARSHGSLEYDVPTMWNVSSEGQSPVHNPISCGASPRSEFDVLTHQHNDIDVEGTHVIDVEGSHVQFFDRSQKDHSGPRWTILGDSLMDVFVQGPFALVGLKMSHASSPVKDVLVRVVIMVYAVGFLSAIGGKLRGSSIMGGIGSGAAVLGFLGTMILLLI